MPYLIGTDEAGYGPNLGPLVISATVWRVPGDPRRCDLYKRLKSAVACVAEDALTRGLVAIADSKALYKSGQGLHALERGVLAALSLLGDPAISARELWRSLDSAAFDELDALPWHVGRDVTLPIEAIVANLAEAADRLRRTLSKAKIELVGIHACAVFPSRFNQLTDKLGSKGEALSRLTLALLGQAMQPCGDEPVHVVCDKHGGRGYYRRLLQQQFPDPLVEVVCEGAAKSVYRWGPDEQRVEICFRPKGESFLPAALASMTAKYLRELAMHSFNEFWCERVAGLRPTAGYPGDSRRFKKDIESAQALLGIGDDILWRRR